MDSPTKNSFSLSIREILLAITAIAAVLAAVYNNLPHQPTKFNDGFSIEDAIESVAKDMNLPFEQSMGSGSSGGGTEGIHEDKEFLISSPGESNRNEVMTRLMEHIQSVASESGCQMSTVGTSGGGGERSINSFTLMYNQGRSFGVVRAHSFPAENGEWRLIFFRFEK